VQYNDKKATYDSVAAGLESNRSKLEMVCEIFLFVDCQYFVALSVLEKVKCLKTERDFCFIKSFLLCVFELFLIFMFDYALDL